MDAWQAWLEHLALAVCYGQEADAARRDGCADAVVLLGWEARRNEDAAHLWRTRTGRW